MTKKLFGFHHAVVREPTLRVGTTDEGPIEIETPKAPEAPAMLYAVSVPRRGGLPLISQYENNEDGLHELANLVRGENVLAVFVGHRVQVEATNVVELNIKGKPVADRIVLDR
jgi:hypothetical protein